MKEEEIRYEKDGESLLGDAEKTNDVLDIIINNYHSQIINKYRCSLKMKRVKTPNAEIKTISNHLK